MTSDKKIKPLADLLELIIDHRGKTPNKLGFDDFQSSGIPVLSAKHVKTDMLIGEDSMRYASKEMYKKWMSVELKEGDIVVTSEAPMGEVLYLPTDKKYVLGQRVFGIRANKSEIDPRYLAAWLASDEGQRQIAARSSGSTVQGIRQSELLKIEVEIPDRPIQEIIAKNRFSIIEKIEVNKRITLALEGMAQAIFKSWFVDFDPVKAKIAALQEGRDPLRAAMSAISGKSDDELDALPKSDFEALASIAKLFPDDMEEVASAMAPVGWKIRRAGDVFELAYGKALKSTDRVEGDIPVYGSGGITGYHNVALVEHASVIVGRKGTVGALYWEDGPFFPIDTTFYVKPIAAPLTYCYYAMQRLGLNQMNTDAAVPGLNRENVYRLDVVWPGDALLIAFDTLVSPMRKTIHALQTQSKTLASLRDALLPKLLSGEIFVKDSTDQLATAKDM